MTHPENSMLLGRHRELVVACSQRLGPDGLAVGTAGNISARSGELVAITPSGIDYTSMTPGLVCVVGLDGEPIEAELAPSTELPMHLAVYAHLQGANAVVHTHPPFATALSTLLDELPPIHYLIATLGGPVRVAPYATPGTDELAKSMAAALRDRSAVLLQNHGAITIGDSVESAYSRSLTQEWLSALYYRARLLGDPRLLSEEEIGRVAEAMSDYGRPSQPL